MTIRLVLVDDHPVVRAGMRALLEGAGMVVAGEAGDAATAERVVAETDPDVVCMDLALGDGPDGVECTRRLVAAKASRRVLILTTFDTHADILRAIEAGAAGYLLKDAEPARLIAAIESAARGETVLAPVVAASLTRASSSPDSLTARELEVLSLVAEGASNRQIARRLFLSEATVKTHLAHAFDKLQAENRTAAVAAARALGLLR